MALRRVPAPDLLKVTVRQPVHDLPPAGHCFISFRAGLLHRNDGKLTADKRKGQVAIVRNEEGLTALQWYERVFPDEGSERFQLSDEPEIDQLIFEFEGRFEWVNKERRLLKMAFKEEPERSIFFWLQEPDTQWDADILSRCNGAINGTRWAAEQAAKTAQAAGTSTSAAAPAQATAAGRAPAGGLQSAQAALLQQLIQAAQMGQMQDPASRMGFQDLLTGAELQQRLFEPGVPERLVEFLPEGLQTREELRDSAQAPQLWQQMRALSRGIQTGRIDVTQFGVSPKGPGVVAFLEALQEHVDAKRGAEKARWKGREEAGAMQADISTPKGGQPDGDGGDAMDET